LARRSFELHAQLSSELGDSWGYRQLTTYSGYAAEDDAAHGLGGRPWLAGGVTITGRLGTTDSTAVVEPRAFTTGLMRAAQEHGAVLRHGTVVDLVGRLSGAVRGVALASGEIVDGDDVDRDGTVVDPGRARAIAWCLKPVGPFRPRHCSSSTARRAAKS
jgi:glycine/D-amino acid oxidase-like deaminating enzyme